MLTTIVKKYKIGAVALLPLFLFAISQSAAAQTGNAEEGRRLFEQNCAKCHGIDGSGNTPVGKAVGAKDLRAPEAQKMSDDQIYNQIDKGNGNMPSLADAINRAKADQMSMKVKDLIAYIREIGQKQQGVATKKP